MRYLLGLVLGLLVGLQPVHACLHSGLWENVFFETTPDPQLEADVIATVSIADQTSSWTDAGYMNMATATIDQVMKTSDARIREGERIAVQFGNSSCDGASGKGMVIAKVRTDGNGRLVLHPYTHENDSGKISPPTMLPNGFGMSPQRLQVGDAIPKNFAVLLIGVVGPDTVRSLLFEQSARPWMNTRFPEQSNAVMAFAIPVGIKKLSLVEARMTWHKEGVYTDGSVTVQTPPLNIDRPGIYYVATLDTNRPGRLQAGSSAEQLRLFRAQNRTALGELEPMNFKWPDQ